MSSSKPLLLFDVDGTLLLTYGAGARAMERAGKLVWGEGFSTANVNFGGSLDPVIVEQATRDANLAFSEETHLRFRAAYCEELQLELVSPGARAFALPGAVELVQTLRTSGTAILGLLTGNYEETGSQKLTAIGLDPGWFSPRIWGDAAPTRPGLVREALRRHPDADPRQAIVVGDTTRDVHCAKVNGCRALGVATGASTKAELLAAGADVVVDDLVDPTPLLELMAKR